MSKKNQSSRLVEQHKLSKGVIGIFGEEAKKHDFTVSYISKKVMNELEKNILICNLDIENILQKKK